MSKKPRTRPNTDEQYSRIALGSIAAAFFIAITSVFPLYISRHEYYFITKQKTDLFIMFTAIAAVAVVLALFFTTSRFQVKNYFVEGEPKRKIAIHEWTLGAFLLLTLASAVFSPWQDFVWRGHHTSDISGRWEGFWAFLCYGVAFLIIARFYRPKRLHFFILACSTILLCLHGVSQYLGWDFLRAAGIIEIEYFNEISPLSRTHRTTLGNINIVSAYCSLVIMLFAVLFTEEDSKWGYLYLAASIISFAMLCITQGDSGRVGVLGAMVLLIPYWMSNKRRFGKILITVAGWSAAYALNGAFLTLKKGQVGVKDIPPLDLHFLATYEPLSPMLFFAVAAVLLGIGLCILHLVKKWPERPMKIAGVMFLILSIGGGLLFVEFGGRRWEDQPNNVIWQAREVLHGNLADNFGSNRGWVWKSGMSVVWNNPILGTGPDTFFFALGGLQNEQGRPFVPEDSLLAEGLVITGLEFDKAHNTFLQIAVCMGIPAFLAYLAYLGGIFIPAIKKAFNRPFLFAFGAAALSYLIQSFFQVDTPIDRPLLYIALGVMAGELWREKVGA